jgi:hypothetical protein
VIKRFAFRNPTYLLAPDVIDFQSAMLGEDIALDISSVRAAKIQAKKEKISNPGCRIQIWHESRRAHGVLSDKSSYITNDTVLSGPAKEKTRARYNRLIIFFSRLEEYMSIFSRLFFRPPHSRSSLAPCQRLCRLLISWLAVTDDVELEVTGLVSVTIKAHKYTGVNVFRSRTGIKGYYARRSSHAAGFLLGAATVDPTDEELYDSFEKITIEFESERGTSVCLPWFLGSPHSGTRRKPN